MNASTTPTSIPVFRRILVWSAAVAVAVAVVGSILGFVFAGWNGVWSALIAAAMTLVFAGITVLSLMLAATLDTMYFFAVILGGWMLKFVAFLVVLSLIRDAPFVHPVVLFACFVGAVIATLAVDVIVVMTSRMSHVSDVRLPGQGDTPA